MNLLTLYPIQSCNLTCKYCPTKKWIYPINHEYNRLNNDLIFSWLDKFCPPEEWCIEVSGGEPGVYPEIEGLVNGLTERGYYGLIKTNGTLPIPHSDNFQRVAAWHKCSDIDNPPKYYDTILLIKNPDDCWEEKRQYCIDNEIPYKEIIFRNYDIPYAERQEPEDTAFRNTFIKNWTVAYSSGQLARCYGHENIEGVTIQNMSPPPQINIWKYCQFCINIKNFEIFMTDGLKQKLAVRGDKSVLQN
jgi:organic radical activating enzyme